MSREQAKTMSTHQPETPSHACEPAEETLEPAARAERGRSLQVNRLEDGEDVSVIQLEREPLTDVSCGY